LAETKRVLFRGLSAIPEEQNAPGGAKAERAGSALAGEVGLRPLDNAPWLKRNFHLQNGGFSMHKLSRVRPSTGRTSRGGECSPRLGFLQIVGLDNLQGEKVASFRTGSAFRGRGTGLRRIV